MTNNLRYFMAKYAIFVVGSAGSGKSTLCAALETHLRLNKRPVHVVNLDPAAESFQYTPSCDIRELIPSDEAMTELKLGPNGALLFCMQFLVENWDWFDEQIGDYHDDYLIVDCPGQVEVYTHLPVMSEVVGRFTSMNYRCCSVYCCDATLVNDAGGYVSASLSCLSTMFSLGTSHVSVMTKCDLLSEQQKDRFDVYRMPSHEALRNGGRINKLQMALVDLIESESLLQFVPLDLTEEDNASLDELISGIDMCVGYGEDEETEMREVDME